MSEICFNIFIIDIQSAMDAPARPWLVHQGFNVPEDGIVHRQPPDGSG